MAGHFRNVDQRKQVLPRQYVVDAGRAGVYRTQRAGQGQSGRQLFVATLPVQDHEFLGAKVEQRRRVAADALFRGIGARTGSTVDAKAYAAFTDWQGEPVAAGELGVVTGGTG